MSVTMEFEVECNECGKALNAYNPRGSVITIDPCEYCLDASFAEGRAEGIEESLGKLKDMDVAEIVRMVREMRRA